LVFPFCESLSPVLWGAEEATVEAVEGGAVGEVVRMDREAE
jgi:hypothetical protein